MANMGEKALEVVEIGAGTTGAAYLSNKLIGDKILPSKYHGLAFLAIGVLGNMFVAEPHLNNVAKGMGAFGTLRSTGDFILPKQKADLGLSGMGASAEVDWDELARKAQEKADAEAGMKGDENMDGFHNSQASSFNQMHNAMV